jgi:UDP-2,4-diacetamido-2,4,6-trideoxy-beta-L-altropyranose hydrolase
MNLLIRADANVAMGTGHVMRCLALAQAWVDCGGAAIFVFSEMPPALAARLHSENLHARCIDAVAGTVDDARRTAALARDVNADWIVLDGYQFGAKYQSTIKDAGCKLLVIDDNGSVDGYCADIILNQNLHAVHSLYQQRAEQSRLLLGSRYCLLRREFRRWCGWKRNTSAEVKKVLITMGGSDPDNVTSRMIQSVSLCDFGPVKITVLVGGSNPHRELLRAQIEGRTDIELVADSDDMPGLLASSDIAIAGAGTTCWEMCLLGLPSILVELAPNQHEIGRGMHELGAGVFLGAANEVSSHAGAALLKALINAAERRQHMSEVAQQVVDGKGAERVVSLLKHGVRLRKAEDYDCQMFWEWANDPEVRAMSFCSDPITWETHVGWFASKRCDPSYLLYVASDEKSQPVGQVRYQFDGERAVLSISLRPEVRGKGLGKPILLNATEELFQISGAKAIDAFVKPENHTSQQLFQSAGFHKQGISHIHGQPAIHFALRRPGVA